MYRRIVRLVTRLLMRARISNIDHQISARSDDRELWLSEQWFALECQDTAGYHEAVIGVILQLY